MVSVEEKAHMMMRQEGIRKANASEPLMKGRNYIQTMSKPGSPSNPGSSMCWRSPVYGQHDIRPLGGASTDRAQTRNLGTCRLDAKGKAQAETPRGREYRRGRRSLHSEAQGRNDP